MKNILKSIFAFIIFTIIGFLIYWNTNTYILSVNLWKYNYGYYMSDCMPRMIDIGVTIKNRILFINEKPQCKIIFCSRNTLVIQSLSGGDYGYYERK
jgi:hypothetical protein